MATVLIKKGFHAGKSFKNIEFTAVRPVSMGHKGPFIMVNGAGVVGFPQRNFKVFVHSKQDFEFRGEDAEDFESGRIGSSYGSVPGTIHNKRLTGLVDDEVKQSETDDEIKARLAERFEIMERMALAAAQGAIRGLVVSGAPGTGKSFGIEHALDRDSIQDKLAFDPANADHDPRRHAKGGEFKPRYKFIKGFITPGALYKQLYEYNEPREVLVFDDCDSVLKDDLCLGMLKTALDTSGKRTMYWLTNSNRGDDAPDHFEFRGSVIFITNINFEHSIARGGSLAPHLDAILDRCLYLDLTIHTKREKLIRIDHVAQELKMLEKKGLSTVQVSEVMQFVHDHADRFPRLSLRKVDQLADIRLANTATWQREAEVMLLKVSR